MSIPFNCFFITFSNIFENAFSTLTGRKFLSTVGSDSPLSSGHTAARFALSGNLQLRILIFIALVRGISSSAAAKDTNFGGI